MLERERRWRRLDRQRQEVTKKGDRCRAEREREGKKTEKLKKFGSIVWGQKNERRKAGEVSNNGEKQTGREQCKAGDWGSWGGISRGRILVKNSRRAGWKWSTGDKCKEASRRLIWKAEVCLCRTICLYSIRWRTDSGCTCVQDAATPQLPTGENWRHN